MRPGFTLLLVLSACTPRYPVDEDGAGAGGGAAPDAAVGPEDHDGDGVCDKTELGAGTDPAVKDTDGDGFPDVMELVHPFDPNDPSSPDLDQVGFLAANSGSSYEFDVRATVQGLGETYTGQLRSYPSLDVQDRVASDFFASARAVAAEPPENVHAIDADGARFEAVVGKTRLQFRVRFEYGSNEDFECAQGYSFSYSAKSDQGGSESSRDYLLVITPKEQSGSDADAFCLPAACL